MIYLDSCNTRCGRGCTRGEGAHGEAVRGLLDGVAFVELTPPVLARALEPFPTAVRTLDALHLATMDFLRSHGRPIELGSYDTRLLAAARAIQIPICQL